MDPLGGKNKWYPLAPGTQTLRDGSINRGSRKLTHKLRVTVTDVTKVVNGVTTVAVLDQDIDAGQVGEASLDFLAQEFMRESNTLCSKSAAAALTTVGLDLKAAVEQFREQIQNVE